MQIRRIILYFASPVNLKYFLITRLHQKPSHIIIKKYDVLSLNTQYENMIAKHIIFVGRVQGVGFRFTSYHIAGRHRLTGQVRNLLDGAVEMFAQGEPADVDDCIQDIKDSFGAYITQTKIEDTPLNPQYTDFKITF